MCVILESETAEGTRKVMRRSGIGVANICTKVLDSSGFKELVGFHDRKVNDNRSVTILKRVDLFK